MSENLIGNLSNLLSSVSLSDKKDTQATNNMGTAFTKELPFTLKDVKETKQTDLMRFAKYIKEGKAKNIIVMVGAGISVSCGIADFRTPGTGLYDNLQKYNLAHATDVFDIEFFKVNPKPFNMLAKELFPGPFKPSLTHYFIRLLHEKGVLLRLFSQNIDGLEALAGLPENKIVQAHGSFNGAKCINCLKEHEIDQVRTSIMKDQIPVCAKCNGYVKPNIVFFGEDLPERYYRRVAKDFPKCDLLVVLGTSLLVKPFALLTQKVDANVPRLLINNEIVGDFLNHNLSRMRVKDGMHITTCDGGVQEFCDLLGWTSELNQLATLTTTTDTS